MEGSIRSADCSLFMVLWTVNRVVSVAERRPDLVGRCGVIEIER